MSQFIKKLLVPAVGAGFLLCASGAFANYLNVFVQNNCSGTAVLNANSSSTVGSPQGQLKPEEYQSIVNASTKQGTEEYYYDLYDNSDKHLGACVVSVYADNIIASATDKKLYKKFKASLVRWVADKEKKSQCISQLSNNSCVKNAAAPSDPLALKASCAPDVFFCKVYGKK